MYILSTEMAELCRMTKQGFHKMVKKLKIPYIVKGNKYVFDTNAYQFSDFFKSIEFVVLNPKLQVFYSVSQLAKLRCQSRHSIHNLLKNGNINFYRNGKKFMILLVDIHRIQQLADEKRQLLLK